MKHEIGLCRCGQEFTVTRDENNKIEQLNSAGELECDDCLDLFAQTEMDCE